MHLLRWSVVVVVALTCSLARAQEEKELDVQVAAKLSVELGLQGYPENKLAHVGLSGVRSFFGRLRPAASVERVCAAFDSAATLTGPHREVEGRQAIVAVFRCVSAAGARTFFDELRALEAAQDEEMRSGAVAGLKVDEALLADATVEGASVAYKARKRLTTPDGPIQARKLVFVVGEYVLEVAIMGEAKGEHVEAVSQALIKALARG